MSELSDAEAVELVAPARREGHKCGYQGKTELWAAVGRLTSALSALARDVRPEARLRGAQIAAEAAEMLGELAGRAEAESTELKRLEARTRRAAAKIEAKLQRERETEQRVKAMRQAQGPPRLAPSAECDQPRVCVHREECPRRPPCVPGLARTIRRSSARAFPAPSSAGGCVTSECRQLGECLDPTGCLSGGVIPR